MNKTVAAGSPRTKLDAHPSSSGDSRRPEEPLSLLAWQTVMASQSPEVYGPHLTTFGPKEFGFQPGIAGRKAITGQGQDQECAVLSLKGKTAAN